MKKIIKRAFYLILMVLFIQQIYQHETRACDVAVVSASASATGRPFIWKNRDHTDSYRHQLVYCPAVNNNVGGCLKLIAETVLNSTADPATTCSGGANESGFAIANTTVYDSNDPYDAYNVNTNIVEKALEQCRTLEEFETVAKNYQSYWPQSSKTISGNFAVIDAYGGAAIYEMWTEDGRGASLKFRKFNVNTAIVTDQDRNPVYDNKYSSIETTGFNNRTNSFHTANWREIASDTPRELRARRLLSDMRDDLALSPRNVMRYISKDVCGDNPASSNIYNHENTYTPADYFYDPADQTGQTVITNIWDNSNDDNDTYLTPNYDGEMFTAYCISRYQTTMGLVIEGVADPDQASLTTMWVALGEPSLSVFIPFFPHAQHVSPYATHNTHTNTGYYWDGDSPTSSTKPTCFLNLLFDCVEANPFTSSGDYPALYAVYSNISLYKNNGAGISDLGYRTYGSTYVMDTTINYPRLINLQQWTLPLENIVFDNTDDFLNILNVNPSLITRKLLSDFSHNICDYVYKNYTTHCQYPSAAFTVWNHALPDDGFLPSIISIYPSNGGSGLSGIVPVTCTFSEPVDQSTINSSTFILRNGTSPVSGTVNYNVPTRTATFTPSSSLANNSVYTIELTTGIKDLAGKNLAANYITTFSTVDDIHPSVVSISPSYGDINPPVTTQITVVFSEPVDPSSVNADTFRLGNGSVIISGSVTYDPLMNTATFTPAGPLQNGITYTVTLSTAIKDTSGNSLTADYLSTFTTISGNNGGQNPDDSLSPTVLSVIPAHQMINIPVNTSITVVFSEPVNPSTINENTFILKNGTVLISGSTAYNSSSNTATFTPYGSLMNSTTYTIMLTSGIEDITGNKLSVNYISTFTTMSGNTGGSVTPDDGLPPKVISINPANGVVNPPVYVPVTVKFSKPVDPSTINQNTFILMNETGRVSGSVVYDSLLHAASFYPDTVLSKNVTYTVILSTGIKDLAGNSLTSSFSSVFTITTGSVEGEINPVTGEEIPVITSVNTGNGGAVFPVDGSILVQFSEPMDPASINNNTFIIFNENSAVTGTISYDQETNTALFTPDNPLSGNTTYTVDLTTGIMTISGESLADDYTWEFTTTADGSAPAISWINPPDQSIQFPLNGIISATFTKLMDQNTINTDSFKLSAFGIGTVVGSLNYDQLSGIASFTPAAPLLGNTTYTVELTSDIKDREGNSITSTRWSFTTDSAADGPAVSSGGDNGGGCGCGSSADASTSGNSSRPLLPGLFSLLGTMLFPLFLILLRRNYRKKRFM